MKRLILALGVVALLFSSCGKKELEEKIITQQKLQDSIQAVLSAKDAEMESLFQELNAIEQSLSEVSAKYGNVNKLKNNSGEKVNKDTRARITDEIQNINELLASNKQKLSKLNNQMAANGNKNKELATFVENLQTRVNEQEAQIQALTAELQQKKIVIENLNKNIDDLSKQNQVKDQQILQVESEKNTAYYMVGTKKQLQAEGVVNVSGGFLGIGKKAKVSGDSDLSKYTKVDIRQFENIPLNGKNKIKILTSHPSSSYTLEGGTKYPTAIKIKDAASFWGKSRFLVIMYE
ncbi:MAG: hypothetical protein WC108_05155 [Bacteroidales bacterium]|jgi:DNA repair exonuclease SbcCD ATPase subunit|nr:hypothetical protein [Bacteroidales bacterium]MDD4001170.1 hypothetical protein [Bacteroidales bacterium]MDD4528563.1 hypothetical protein [Bacteroidales bacterium]MDD4829490.1 hypothetical protein [Bacteroidales bacterium]